jgi:hypothetical protein
MGYIAKKLKETLKANHLQSAHSKAWLALGLAELQQVLHPASQGLVQQDMPGLYGRPTVYEANQDRMKEKGEEAPEKGKEAPQQTQEAPAIAQESPQQTKKAPEQDLSL